MKISKIPKPKTSFPSDINPALLKCQLRVARQQVFTVYKAMTKTKPDPDLEGALATALFEIDRAIDLMPDSVKPGKETP